VNELQALSLLFYVPAKVGVVIACQIGNQRGETMK
jgi:hypothetical protein